MIPKQFLPVSILFLLIGAVAAIFRQQLTASGIDAIVLLLGNLFLFLLTYVSFLIARKGLHNQNPHAFSRSVMGSIMIKMFLAVIAAFVYISIYKKELNKPALFICMGLYLVYTFLEVSALTRLLRQKPHA